MSAQEPASVSTTAGQNRAGSDLVRANEVGFGKGTRFLIESHFVRVLKAGFGCAVEVKFDCANLTWATGDFFTPPRQPFRFDVIQKMSADKAH